MEHPLTFLCAKPQRCLMLIAKYEIRGTLKQASNTTTK
jgi:hypothetical protein